MLGNRGRQPPGTEGRRVYVLLRNGMRPPESWPADGRAACRWTLTGGPFDIIQWELAQ